MHMYAGDYEGQKIKYPGSGVADKIVKWMLGTRIRSSAKTSVHSWSLNYLSSPTRRDFKQWVALLNQVQRMASFLYVTHLRTLERSCSLNLRPTLFAYHPRKRKAAEWSKTATRGWANSKLGRRQPLRSGGQKAEVRLRQTKETLGKSAGNEDKKRLRVRARQFWP